MLAKATAGDIIKYGAAFKSTSALAANTPENVVAAASNLKGIIVWRAGQFTREGSGVYTTVALLGKATAPASIFDGDPYMYTESDSITATDEYYSHGKLERPIFVPAGKRLDFIADNAETAGRRFVLYTIL